MSYDHYLVNKVYSSGITVTNIYESFTHKMATKTSWHRYGTKLRHCHPMYFWNFVQNSGLGLARRSSQRVFSLFRQICTYSVRN